MYFQLFICIFYPKDGGFVYFQLFVCILYPRQGGFLYFQLVVCILYPNGGRIRVFPIVCLYILSKWREDLCISSCFFVSYIQTEGWFVYFQLFLCILYPREGEFVYLALMVCILYPRKDDLCISSCLYFMSQGGELSHHSGQSPTVSRPSCTISALHFTMDYQ